MRKMILGVVSALLMLGGAFSAIPVYADEGDDAFASANILQVAPSAVRVTLDAGEVLEGNAEHCPSDIPKGCVIQVTNTGNTTYRYRVYTTPYVVKGEDNALSFDEVTSYTQLSRWITIRNDAGEYVKEAQFTIGPNESQTISYRVDVPEDIPGGSQYAVIWAQVLSDGSDASIQTVGQIGSVITGRSTGDTNEAGEILEYDFQKFAFSGPLTAHAAIKNTGNTDFAAHYSYIAKTFFGKELFKDEGMIPAYPGTTYKVDTTWEEVPFFGIFQVEFKITVAGEERSESRIVIVMPIIMMILFILLLTIIIVWIIIIIRKRKERKTRKLV